MCSDQGRKPRTDGVDELGRLFLIVARAVAAAALFVTVVGLLIYIIK
jgi:hypothetical protein